MLTKFFLRHAMLALPSQALAHSVLWQRQTQVLVNTCLLKSSRGDNETTHCVLERNKLFSSRGILWYSVCRQIQKECQKSLLVVVFVNEIKWMI